MYLHCYFISESVVGLKKTNEITKHENSSLLKHYCVYIFVYITDLFRVRGGRVRGLDSPEEITYGLDERGHTNALL